MAQGGGIAAFREGVCGRSEVGAPEVLLQSGVEKEVARCNGKKVFTFRMAGVQKVVGLFLNQNRGNLQNGGALGTKPFRPGFAGGAGW